VGLFSIALNELRDLETSHWTQAAPKKECGFGQGDSFGLRATPSQRFS
jgi:hypothetical protein